MKLNDMLPFRTAFGGLILLVMFVNAVNGFNTVYCSNENTGSDGGDGPFYNIYNSNGECTKKCGDYAFAVVQGKNCWCSNYIPADQSSISDCNSKCPGYPYEVCGNPDEGLYGYLEMDKAPLGTAGGAARMQSPTPTRVPGPPPSEIPSSTLPPSSYPTSSSSNDKTTTKYEVTTKVTLISGSRVTQTVTSTPVGAAPNTASSDRPALKGAGLSEGAIAGVAIGTLSGFAVVAAAAFLLWRRRRSSDPEGGSSRSPKRKGSVLSRAGLLGGARPQSMAENNYDDPYYGGSVTRPSSIRHSMMYGGAAPGDGITPAGPLINVTDSSSDKRQSKPLVYDQRMNPSALWVHHDNGSRTSMQDQQDYSRPLGLANPDFARSYSFDSR